jgi:hypothetical protein
VAVKIVSYQRPLLMSAHWEPHSQPWSLWVGSSPKPIQRSTTIGIRSCGAMPSPSAKPRV